MSENRVIGDNNQLPWHLPADLKHFKTLTEGHPVLMGRKTHEAIGIPLPNRTNIIITHNADYQAPGCLVVTSLEKAMACTATLSSPEIFIIGGAQVYQQFLPQIERIYLTIVHEEFDGDVYFPEMDTAAWQEIERTRHEADEKNAFAYSFLILDKVAAI